MYKELLLTSKEELNALNLFKLGALVTIASRPGVGKSTFSLKLLLDIIKNNNIGAILFNLESSKEQLEKKLTTFNNKSITNLNITIYDNPKINIEDIKNIINAKVQKSNTKLVIIDYIELIASDTKNLQEAKSYISRSLKLLAIELNICIICLTQISKSTIEDNEPFLKDIRISGSLVQDSDVIMFLYKDNQNARNLKIAKNRFGPTKVFLLDSIK